MELQLVELPDTCLYTVLQYCADDVRSLCSAARAHSKLHQAAVHVLQSVTAELKDPLQLVSVLEYLSKHGDVQPEGTARKDAQHRLLSSIILSSYGLSLEDLPKCAHLTTLQLSNFTLLLSPGCCVDSYNSVLRAWPGLALGLKQLRLKGCKLLDGPAELAAALSELPFLEHLTLDRVCLSIGGSDWAATLSIDALQELTLLTHLELVGIRLQNQHQGQPVLQPLHALTRLADLRLQELNPVELSAGMLSPACQLTHLELCGADIAFAPDALADKPMLQHLHLDGCSVKGGAAQLLPQLQTLQQLTQLHLQANLTADDGGYPALEAYTALTASSKLQYLTLQDNTLPACGGQLRWLYPGDKRPHMLYLWISTAGQPVGVHAANLEGIGLADWCPGLQSLKLKGLQCPQELLAQLQGLRELHTLRLCPVDALGEEGVQAVCRLTQLRLLELSTADTEGMLLQLTQLQQLSQLGYFGNQVGAGREMHFYQGAEPVWKQLEKLHNPTVVQQAHADAAVAAPMIL